MKKSILAFVLIMLLAVFCAAAAEDGAGYKVTYLENDCLAQVPTDETVYQQGDNVTVLFEPVAYKDYLIFYGWDMNNDGVADFGYSYKNFTMPANDVELKAICISPSYQQAPDPCYSCPPPRPHHHGPFPPEPGPRPAPGPRPGPRPPFPPFFIEP